MIEFELVVLAWQQMLEADLQTLTLNSDTGPEVRLTIVEGSMQCIQLLMNELPEYRNDRFADHAMA